MSDNVTLNEDQNVKLKRTAGFWSLVFFGIVFMQPTSGLVYVGYTQIVSSGHSALTFLAGAIVVFFTCLSYAKMVEIYPNAGSAYTYTSKGLNSKVGFLVGWVMLLDYVLNPMLIFAIAALYLNRFVPAIPVFVWVLIFAVAVWAVNIVGLQIAKIFNFGAAIFQLLLAVAFAVLSTIYLLNNDHISVSEAIYNPDTFNFLGVLGGATIVILLFLGFDGISTVAEESTTSPKMVGNAIKTAVIIQAVILIILTIFASMLLPKFDQIENVDTIVYDLYTLVGGEVFNAIVLIVTQVLAILATNTIVMSGSRLLYAMGRDGVLPKKVFGYLSPQFQTPTRSIAAVIIVSVIGAYTIDWTHISEIVAFGAMVGFACVNITVIKVFFFDRKERKIFSNMIFPILGLAFVLVVMIGSSTMCKIVGGGWLVVGLVYLLVRYKSSETFRDAVNKGLDIE